MSNTGSTIKTTPSPVAASAASKAHTQASGASTAASKSEIKDDPAAAFEAGQAKTRGLEFGKPTRFATTNPAHTAGLAPAKTGGVKTQTSTPCPEVMAESVSEATLPPAAGKLGRTLEDASANSHYKLVPTADGQFKLVHKLDPKRSYLITIHPHADLGASDQMQVGAIVGKLLGLLEHEEKNHGGIKSVTFSGDGGSLMYHNNPSGKEAIPFGGSDPLKDLKVSGPLVRQYLKELEAILGGHRDFAVSLESREPIATEKAEKEAPTYTAPPGDAASAAPSEAPVAPKQAERPGPDKV